MGIRTYENFDVSIEPAGPQRYRARVTSGEADDEVAAALVELATAIGRLAEAVRRRAE